MSHPEADPRSPLRPPAGARAMPATGWSEAPVGLPVAGSSEARRIPTATGDEQQHGRVVRERHSAPGHSRGDRALRRADHTPDLLSGGFADHQPRGDHHGAWRPVDRLDLPDHEESEAILPSDRRRRLRSLGGRLLRFIWSATGQTPGSRQWQVWSTPGSPPRRRLPSYPRKAGAPTSAPRCPW